MSSPRSCRILTISSSTSRAQELVQQIIAASDSATQERPLAASENGHSVPWTISNKYYTAPVHFSLAQTSQVKGEDVVDVPACIFVFSLAESFKEGFSSLISRLEDSDFEVSIAVSVPSPGTEQSQATDDEQDALEAFFGEFGFEYVQDHSIHDHETPHGHDIDDMQGIPGIGRIVDALSTILWPSMVQQAGSRRAKARSVVSVPGPPGEEDSLRSLLNADKNPSSEADTSLQHEMAALEKWLEEGADDEKDPWSGVAQSSQSQSESAFSRPPESGFDDNFSDFVSAPARVDVDNDPALPSQEEVESTARRIFDTALSEDLDDGDGQTPFDLSRVLGALEAMKEEIAGITDEDEKRKAAAKVALGLVYGLDEG